MTCQCCGKSLGLVDIHTTGTFIAKQNKTCEWSTSSRTRVRSAEVKQDLEETDQRLTISSVKLKTGWNYSTIKRLTKTDYSKYLHIVKQVYWRSLKCQVVGKRHTHESTAKTPAFKNYITAASASDSTTEYVDTEWNAWESWGFISYVKINHYKVVGAR